MTTSLNISSDSMIDLSISEKRNWLTAMLRENDCVINFTKKDGTERVMQCTLKEGIAIPYEKKTERTREGKEDILPVWDLEAAAWRSINIPTVKTLEFIFKDS